MEFRKHALANGVTLVVGFSYDELVPSALDLLSNTISAINGSVETNTTFVTGTLPTQNPSSAANTTSNAARILWAFTQVFVQEFPEHETSDDRISVWTNSVCASSWQSIICAR